jgi:CRISPR-associated protein Cmr6
MAAPLYVDLNMPKTCQGHYGLWFERFFDQYIPQKWEVSDHKAVWLRDFNHKVVGDRNQLEVYSQSQYTLCQALNGQQQVFKASWHFVTGMGNPHPVENGFAWHPTLGVPYLTGAAVKGIIRAYIDNYPYLEPNEPNEPLKKELLLNWFGSTSKDPTDTDYKAQGGALIFFDAVPIKPVQLGVDIMTPHMGDWYAKGNQANEVGQPDNVPADWHDPVPISFLVAKDITLLFSFAFRPNAPDKDKIKLEDVAYVLEQALQYAGAGAKTATGYGQMQSLAALERLKQQTALQDAEIIEAYLKRNLKNKSLFLEHQRKSIATLTNQDKVTEILNQLDNLNQQKIAKGEGVKVKAYVLNKEIIQLVND